MGFKGFNFQSKRFKYLNRIDNISNKKIINLDIYFNVNLHIYICLHFMLHA